MSGGGRPTLPSQLADIVAFLTRHGRVRHAGFWAMLVWSAALFYLAHLLGDATGRPALTWGVAGALFVGSWTGYFLRASSRRR